MTVSYILEALRKSELERRQGQVPNLTSAPVVIGRSAATHAATPVPYIVAAVVALAAVAALAWWRPWSVPNVPVPAQSTGALPAPVQQASTTEPASKVVPQAQVPGPTSESGRATTVQASTPWVAATASPVGVPRTDRAPRVPAGQRTKTTQAERPASPQPVTPQSHPEAAKETPYAPAEVTAPSEAKDTSRPAAPDRLLSRAELPASVRKDLPQINVAGYSYADDPHERMVVINDRILREGDEVSPGVKLEKIDSDGVVLDYEGFRFRP